MITRNKFLGIIKVSAAALLARLAQGQALPQSQTRIAAHGPGLAWVDNENLAANSVMDGANSVFKLLSPPINGSVLVFRNGLKQSSPDDCTIAGDVITFNIKAIPQPTDILRASYVYSR